MKYQTSKEWTPYCIDGVYFVHWHDYLDILDKIGRLGPRDRIHKEISNKEWEAFVHKYHFSNKIEELINE